MIGSTELEISSAQQADDQMPFVRVFRTELRKLADTRASRVLLLAMFLMTPAIVIGSLVTVDHGDLTYADLVDYCQTPQKVLLPVVAILAITSEWSQRTALTTFTLVPTRWRILVAKLAAIVVVSLLSTVLIFGWAAVGMAAAPITGGRLQWQEGTTSVLCMFLIQVLTVLEGAGFGMVILSSAGAVVTFFVVPNLWSLLLNGTGFQDVSAWVDLNQALPYDGGLGGRAGLHLLSASLLWVALPLALGSWRAARSEPS